MEDVHAPPLQLGGRICSHHKIALSTSSNKLSDLHLYNLPVPFITLGNKHDAFSPSPRSTRFVQHISSPCGGFCDSRTLTCAPQLKSPFDANHHEPHVVGNSGSSPQLFPRSAKHQYVNMPNSTHNRFCLLYSVHYWQRNNSK